MLDKQKTRKYQMYACYTSVVANILMRRITVTGGGFTWTQGEGRVHMDTVIGAGSHGHRDRVGFTWTQGEGRVLMDTGIGLGSHGHRDRCGFTWTQG